MIRVSSLSTNFRRKILPIASLFTLIIGIGYRFFFNPDFGLLDMLIFISFFSIIIYIILYRTIRNVYFEEDFLLADKNKVYFKQIISLEKINFTRYKIYYKVDDTVKSFIFLIDSIPFIRSEILNKIEAKISR